MAVAASITDAHIQDFITRAVKKVCTTMMDLPAGFVEKTTQGTCDQLSTQPHLVGSVGFKGNINGVVNLCLPDPFARNASSRILGMTPAEVAESGDAVVHDVVGEVTNMTVGGFKNALCDIGYPCMLTLPKVVLQDGLKLAAAPGVERHIFQFECAGHRLVADIHLNQI